MKTTLTALNARYNHVNPAVRSLRSSVPDRDIEIVEAGIQDRPFDILGKLLRTEADYFGFSVYIWNIELVRRLTGLLRSARPGAVIFWGGPEAGGDPQGEFELCEDVDFIVRGEGEEIFPKILTALDAGGLEVLGGAEIAGVNFPGESLTTAYPADVNLLPAADPGMIENIENRIVYVEGQRGCPYSCSYCMSSETGRLRLKRADRVLAELAALSDAGAKLIKFVDRTFNAKADFAEEILTGLIRRYEAGNTGTRYHFEISADILSDSLLRLLCEAPEGLFQVEAGVQSTDPDVLKQVSRKQNTNKVLRSASKIIESGASHVHLDLIAGLPGETLEIFTRSFNETCRLKPDMLQLGFLKLLKGTALRNAAQRYNIRYDRCAPYEVVSNADLSAEDLTKLRIFEGVFERFYNSGRWRRLNSFILDPERTFPPFEYYKQLVCFLSSDGAADRALSPKKEAQLLTEFIESFFVSDERTVAAELAAADLIERRENLPDRLVTLLPGSFFPDDGEIMSLLGLDAFREFASTAFPELRLRSPKYLKRDLCLFRLSDRARLAAENSRCPLPAASGTEGLRHPEETEGNKLYAAACGRIVRVIDAAASG